MEVKRILTIDVSRFIDKKYLRSLEYNLYRIFFNDNGLLLPFYDEDADTIIHRIPEIYEEYGINAYKRNVYKDSNTMYSNGLTINNDASVIICDNVLMGGKDYNKVIHIPDITLKFSINTMDNNNYIIFRKNSSEDLFLYDISNTEFTSLSKLNINPSSYKIINGNYLFYQKESKSKNVIFCKVDLTTMKSELIVLDCRENSYKEVGKIGDNFMVATDSRTYIYSLTGKLLEALNIIDDIFPMKGLQNIEPGIMYCMRHSDKVYIWRGSNKYEAENLKHSEYIKIFGEGLNEFDHENSRRYAVKSSNNFNIHIYKFEEIKWKLVQ